VGALNALWVRERRIERTGRAATLHTELGSWPLRRGVVPGEVPVREVLKGRLRVDDREVQIAGVLDDLYDASSAQLGTTWRDDVPTVAVWAPTARDVALRLRRVGGGHRGHDERAREERSGLHGPGLARPPRCAIAHLRAHAGPVEERPSESCA
jgi:hypothetical protein